MRVSHNTITENMLLAIQRNSERLFKAQDRMSQGTRVNRPSDDPAAANHIIELNTALGINRQHVRNIDDGLVWLGQGDAVLGDAVGLLQKSRELAIQAANATMTSEDMQKIARQMEAIIDAMAHVANQSVGGMYLFAGTANTSEPFTVTYTSIDDVADPALAAGTGYVEYQGNLDPVLREISRDFNVQVDAGGQVFGATGAGPGAVVVDQASSTGVDTVFGTLFALRDDLIRGDHAAVSSRLADLDDRLNEIIGYRSELGAETNHLEIIKEQLIDQDIRFTGLVSSLQDTDLARATVEFSQIQLAYQGALAAGAKFMQTRLLDFLRA